MKQEPGENTLKNLQVLTLSHPRDKRKSMFISNPNDETIQEILKFSQPHRYDLILFSCSLQVV